MAQVLSRTWIRPLSRCSTWNSLQQTYTTVSSSIVTQRPRIENQSSIESAEVLPSLVDRQVLLTASREHKTTLPEIIQQYVDNAGAVLHVSLPYESRPSADRRPRLENPEDSCRNVVTVAHCAQVGSEHKITLASGFALDAKGKDGEMLIVTCAHTLEQIRQSRLLLAQSYSSDPQSSQRISGSFIVTGSGDTFEIYPVSSVVSALPRSDLLLLSCAIPVGKIHTLPISPYPAQGGTPIRAHFIRYQKPSESSWTPWIGDTWGSWVQGKILGYRDFAGRETQPGTYDALSHLLFTPIPTSGSSGGPIVEEESGAVVGVMLGSRMDNCAEGVRGWGVPSEIIFEMFSLPGLEGKK